MELPPGWRGYGTKNHIDHPDTAARQQEVDAIRARMAGADRIAVQAALMPYEHLLPPRFRGPNERVDDLAAAQGGAPARKQAPWPSPPPRSRDEHRASQLTFNILRYNPQDPGSKPRMQRYELEEADGMTLFIALNEIREKQDPSLQFDFVCRAGICGSCGMMINGKPGPRLPHAHQEPARGDHPRAAAGVRADRRPVGRTPASGCAA